MKNLFFALVFSLVGTFAFASNGLLVEESTNLIENEINVNFEKSNMNDFNTSKDAPLKVQKKRYLDGCGDWWIVTYDDDEISDYDAYILAGDMIYDATGC